jgi:hypothetical protein
MLLLDGARHYKAAAAELIDAAPLALVWQVVL